MSEYKGICVVAEVTSENKLAGVTLELIGKANELAQSLEEKDVSVLLMTGPKDVSHLIKEIAEAGAKKVFLVQNEMLSQYSTEAYSHAACTAVNVKKPAMVLVGATTTGRDIAPRMSSRLDTGLTADCTVLDINEKGQLAATRPTFGGNLMATILCKNFPQMATVRPKVFPKPDANPDNQVIVENIDVDFSSVELKTKLLEFIKSHEDNSAGIDEADIIVAGGKGMRGVEGFKMLEELASLLGGAVGATRAAVDSGWRNHSEQVGQTGKTVTPKIYIACAISGAIQHIAGMSSSDVIIAINKDSSAPIFKIADYGIVGDVFEVVPALIETLKESKLTVTV